MTPQTETANVGQGSVAHSGNTAHGGVSLDGSAQIADRSYRGYDGELHTRAHRWWFVALATIRAGMANKAFWILAALVALAYIINGAFVYYARDFALRLGGGLFPAPEAIYSDTFFRCLNFTRLPLFLLALVVGAGSIAADNRANALLVYLSKPITKTDYLLGKWAGVFLLLGAVSLLPALLLYGFFVAAYSSEGFLKENPGLWASVIGATLLPALIHSSLIIGFSAWSKSPRMAGASYAGLYFMSAVIMGIASGIMMDKLARPDKPERSAATRGTKSAAKAAPEKAASLKNSDIQQALLVHGLSVAGLIESMGMHLYHTEPSLPGRLRRRLREERQQPTEADMAAAMGAMGPMGAMQGLAQAAEEPPSVGRAPLAPLLALAALLVVLPLLAARARIRAVEVVKG